MRGGTKQTGKRDRQGHGSHGQRHRQNAQLPATHEQPKTCKTLERIIRQRIRTPSQRGRRTRQRYKHNQVHKGNTGAARQKKRRDIWQLPMHCQTRKSRTQPNQIHSRRQQNKLPWQSSNTHRRHARCQNTFQQCHLHTWRKIHDNGHIKLLSHDTPQKTRIHQSQNHRSTPRNYP